MIVLIAGETLAVWSLATIGAALGGVFPWRRWRLRQRERQAVRARLFELCPVVIYDREAPPR